MNYRTAAWLAWSLWALSVALITLSLVLLALIRAHPGIHVFDFWLGNSLVVIDVPPILERQRLRLPLAVQLDAGVVHQL
jgi:hypothetical protein